ncbi:unnamed protein product [Effrenium voratum]|uniref:Uncharacterized protein n=1 Tax=Effrenium voratum TaxID=2562239 RepID=A0AA36N7H9_9DINO|nr:unnamed protein product [Effrenium voratum]
MPVKRGLVTPHEVRPRFDEELVAKKVLELVCKFIPLKADRALPGVLEKTMRSCYWSCVPQVPQVFRPVMKLSQGPPVMVPVPVGSPQPSRTPSPLPKQPPQPSTPPVKPQPSSPPNVSPCSTPPLQPQPQPNQQPQQRGQSPTRMPHSASCSGPMMPVYAAGPMTGPLPSGPLPSGPLPSGPLPSGLLPNAKAGMPGVPQMLTASPSAQQLPVYALPKQPPVQAQAQPAPQPQAGPATQGRTEDDVVHLTSRSSSISMEEAQQLGYNARIEIAAMDNKELEKEWEKRRVDKSLQEMRSFDDSFDFADFADIRNADGSIGVQMGPGERRVML